MTRFIRSLIPLSAILLVFLPVPAQQTPSLEPSDEEALLYFRESERLAHDVYTLFAEEWNLLIFSNIANCEDNHTTKFKQLIEMYGLEDPALDFGVFEGALGDRFSDMIDRGIDSASSVMDPLFAAGYLEELSIDELGQALEATQVLQLAKLYETLGMVSRNHLRAFARHIELLGEPYVAQHLPPEEVELILNSPMERQLESQQQRGWNHRYQYRWDSQNPTPGGPGKPDNGNPNPGSPDVPGNPGNGDGGQ